MKLTRQNLRQLIIESLEDRLSVDPEEDRSGWEVIPDDELHGALSGAIYDLYKYVNGVRPRWVNFKEMSVPELEAMHHRLSMELKDMQRDRSYTTQLIADEEAEEKRVRDELDASALEHPFEQLPSHQGMGRRPLEGPARDVRRGRKISEESETFAGAVRMAKGGNSPMKSRAHPDLVRLLKKKSLVDFLKEAPDPTAQTDIDSELASFTMPVTTDYRWVDAPVGTLGTFLMLDYDDVMELSRLPVLSIKSPAAFKREFWSLGASQKFGKSGKPIHTAVWTIKRIHTYLFGDYRTHRYTNSGLGFEDHPQLKKPMLPPAYTIALIEGIKRAEITEKKLEEATTDDEKSYVATKQGFIGSGNVARLKAALSDILKSSRELV